MRVCIKGNNREEQGKDCADDICERSTAENIKHDDAQRCNLQYQAAI
jgi:hypothetical protein